MSANVFGGCNMLSWAIVALVSQAAGPANVSVASSASPPVPRSCRFASGTVDGSGAQLPAAIDGRKFRTFAQIAAFRSAAPVGRIIVIEGGDLSRQKVGAVDLSAVCFRGTRLVNTVWTGTKGLGIGFINADLTGARLDSVIFDSVLFRNTTLANANASGARFVFGQLDGGWNASLANLNLDNAKMIGFRFICGTSAADGCPFDRKKISMRGTDLSEAKLSTFAFWDAAFAGAKLNLTEIGLDQLTQFADATVAGPVTVRNNGRSVTFNQAEFNSVRATAVNIAAAPDDCGAAATPLRRAVCAAPTGDLIRLQRDIDDLYQRSSGDSGKPSPTHKAYLAALEGCVSRDPGGAGDCIRATMTERREGLIIDVLRTQPLERGSRALYITNDTPFIAASKGNPLMAQLLVASTPSYMLVRKEKGKSLSVRAVASEASGSRCAVFDSSKSKSADGVAMRVWASGADFKASSATSQNAKRELGQCAANVQSGPLIRIPIREADFDTLWAAAAPG
jgi:uncharacterized protein YjbI with pentapeptide repeats